jgi:hypothetical protein
MLSIVLLAAPCTGPVAPVAERVPGVISFYGESELAEVPESAVAGEPFEVMVVTFGGGCITQDGTEVDVSGLEVDVRPYDLESGGEVCTAELRLFEHRATVTVAVPGTAEVRFHGVRRPEDEPYVITREIEVR